MAPTPASPSALADPTAIPARPSPHGPDPLEVAA